jgi:Na+-driven multidrug efflux pump
MTCTYALLGLMNTGTGVMRGLGRTLTSTIISLIGACALRITWATLVFELFPRVDPFTQLALVYVAFPATWLITSVAQFTFSSVILKRKVREIGQ